MVNPNDATFIYSLKKLEFPDEFFAKRLRSLPEMRGKAPSLITISPFVCAGSLFYLTYR